MGYSKGVHPSKRFAYGTTDISETIELLATVVCNQKKVISAYERHAAANIVALVKTGVLW